MDDRVVTKAGAPVVEGVSRVVVDAEEPKYVCRAGLKLEKALAHFGIDVRWARGCKAGSCMDARASVLRTS